MSGGSKETGSTTQSTQPWKESQPALKYSLGEAGNLYKSGVGMQPYSASMVTPYSQQTTDAMGQTLNKANAAEGNMAKPLEAMGQQMDYLSPISRGDFSQDPNFNQTLGRAQEDAAHQVNLGASGMGRYGSATHQGKVAQEVGDLTNRAMLERQRWAQQGLGAAASAMPGAYGTNMQPQSSQMGIGGMYEDLMARQQNDAARVFSEQQSLPWDNLARYNAIASGAGQLGGTQKETTSAPKNYGSVFGGALSGAQMTPTNPFLGAALGAGAGLFNI